jgi:hypothetical protein
VKFQNEIRLRVILSAPPPGVLFGLQEGSGNKYRTIQLQRSGTYDLTFEFAVTLKTQKEAASDPDFAGPLVHGPKGERFIYIDIGTSAGDLMSEWTRRLKIPLRGITPDTLSTLANADGILQITVPGKAKDGGPNCATVKPFPGWILATAT